MTDQPNAEVLDTTETVEENAQPEQIADAGTAEKEDATKESGPDYQKIIAEKAFEAREAKREKKELAERLAALEKQNEPKEPSVPSIPDRYDFDTDEEYNQAIAKRDQALIERSQFKATEQLKAQQEQSAIKAEAEAKQKELNEKVGVYSGRAKEFNIDQAEMTQIGNVLEAYELRPDIVEAILDDESGPLIAKYLASNPQQVQALNSSTWQNGATIYGQVKESASALKPKVTSAPAPADVLKGGASVSSGPDGYKIW